MWTFHHKHYAADLPAFANGLVWAGIWARWAMQAAVSPNGQSTPRQAPPSGGYPQGGYPPEGYPPQAGYQPEADRYPGSS
jgi:hypothetical protein